MWPESSHAGQQHKQTQENIPCWIGEVAEKVTLQNCVCGSSSRCENCSQASKIAMKKMSKLISLMIARIMFLSDYFCVSDDCSTIETDRHRSKQLRPLPDVSWWNASAKSPWICRRSDTEPSKTLRPSLIRITREAIASTSCKM